MSLTNLDPYEELGVERDATTQLIRQAYRQKAKSAHPNAGQNADPEEWERLSIAHAVLTDPEKRKKYDETGTIDMTVPVNDRAIALEIIAQHFGGVMNAFLGSNFNPLYDPRGSNLPAAIAAKIQIEIADARGKIVTGGKVVEFLQDISDRFTNKEDVDRSSDPIVVGFKTQIDAAHGQLAQLEQVIKFREIALDILSGYSFSMMEPPGGTVFFTNMKAS